MLVGCLILLAVEGTEGMVWGHAQFGVVIVVVVLAQVGGLCHYNGPTA